MKRALILSLLVAASTSISALADTITIVPGYGPYQYGNGGEITASLSSGVSGFVPGVTSGFVNSGTFQTFCVELNESLVNGSFTAIPADATQLSGITLNKGTAWLFEQFAAGTLAGYNYSDSNNGADRKASASALQQEIWFLMGTQVPTGSIFDTLVKQNVPDWAQPNDPSFSPTRVLNVWIPGMVGQREGAKQDVLYIPGVPDGGLTLALLGIGLTGIGVVSRRVRK